MSAAPGGSSPADADEGSYYGRPIVKPPVWTWEVPTYAFVGGTAGASALVAAAASATGRTRLARAAGEVAAAGAAVSPALLISDLGRPARFHHMLRVFKPTSPMSVGSWLLAAFGPAAAASAVLRRLGWLPRLQRTAEIGAAALAPGMATYTAVLFADTSIPVWREAHRELPWVFAGSSAAAAGSLATLLVDGVEAEPARRFSLAGAGIELAAHAAMERQLGFLAGPYHGDGRAARLSRAAKTCTATGAALAAVSRRSRRRESALRRWTRRLGCGLMLAGSGLTRSSIFAAGGESATDPTYVVHHQRERIADRQR